MTYLLDTSVIIHYFRGTLSTKTLLNRISQKGSLAISVITYGELVYGAQRSKSFEKEQQHIQDALEHLHITVQPLTVGIVDIYPQAKYFLEQTGNKLDDFDLLIGATAVSQKYILVTDNLRHFKRFPAIVFEE
jgi:tRNA(fMet)-specific endonuclease VapC